MAPKAHTTIGALLLVLGLVVLGFMLVGSITELVSEETFEGGLEPLLALWWILVPIGAVLTALGVSLLWKKEGKAVSPDPRPLPPQEPQT